MTTESLMARSLPRISGVLLAMRVGDFYEFYGEDAETAATALEITLTGREDGENGRIAMAGVPFHSVEKYLAASCVSWTARSDDCWGLYPQGGRCAYFMAIFWSLL